MRRVVFLAFCLAVSVPAALRAAGPATVGVECKVYPLDWTLSRDGTALKPGRVRKELRTYQLPPDLQEYVVSAPGCKDYRLLLEPRTCKFVEIKLEPLDSPLELMGELPSGTQPKSVIFTPDGKHLLAAQLSGAGVDVYSTDPLAWEKEIDIPPAGSKSTGYVEFALLPWRDEIWVSQMTTGQVHVLSLSTLEYRESFPSGGTWSKVILADPRLEVAFVSNWLSNNVSVINVASRKVVSRIACGGIPRGMALDRKAEHLYVANFDNGTIEKYSLASGKRVSTIKAGVRGGAKRHLVIPEGSGFLFATDMGLGDVWVVDLDTDKVVKRIPVGPKLNTVEPSPDGRFLFVSSRGQNNPETYLIKGPDLGTFSVIDTRSLKKVAWVWGRNQPTGVAVSPTGTLAAFTDFLDANVEFYDYRGLYALPEEVPVP